MVWIGSLLDVVLNYLLRWYHCFVLLYLLFTLSWLGNPSKVLCLGKLIVVLLFLLWVYFKEFGKYFASSLWYTHLLIWFCSKFSLICRSPKSLKKQISDMEICLFNQHKPPIILCFHFCLSQLIWTDFLFWNRHLKSYFIFRFLC